MKKLILLLLAPLLVHAAATLEWDANPPEECATNITSEIIDDVEVFTTNVTCSVLAGYRVYSGVETGTYTNSVDVGNVTQWALPSESGRIYYAVTAYNTNTLESAFSDEVFWDWSQTIRAAIRIRLRSP